MHLAALHMVCLMHPARLDPRDVLARVLADVLDGLSRLCRLVCFDAGRGSGRTQNDERAMAPKE